jgi:hypothetical protein
LRATARDLDGGCRGSKPRGCPWVIAFEQRHGKYAVEAIAGADGIDGFDRKWLYPGLLAACDGQKGAFCAALEGYAVKAFGQ